jgi:hypothetical protein
VYKELTNQEADQLIERYIRNRLATNFFSMTFNSFVLNGGKLSSTSPEYREVFVTRYWDGIAAYNAFVESGEFEEAYSSITTAYEIRILHNEVYTENISSPEESDLLSRIEALASKLARPPYKSLVRQYFRETLPQLQQLDNRSLSDIGPGEEHDFAVTFAEALNLPSDRVPNIVDDIRAHRKFHSAVSSSSAELLQDLRHAQSTVTMYKDPVTYFGRCSNCGFETSRSREIDKVIQEYIERHGPSCPAL